MLGAQGEQMIIYKFCLDCDDDQPHSRSADGPTASDMYSYCLSCYARMRATSDEDFESDDRD